VPSIDHAVAAAMASNAVLLHLLKFLTREEARALLMDAQIDLREHDTLTSHSATGVIETMLERL
jgi:hypothetical protein